jgi:hypothetical protein
MLLSMTNGIFETPIASNGKDAVIVFKYLRKTDIFEIES